MLIMLEHPIVCCKIISKIKLLLFPGFHIVKVNDYKKCIFDFFTFCFKHFFNPLRKLLQTNMRHLLFHNGLFFFCN
jgi:hypothetical protein